MNVILHRLAIIGAIALVAVATAPSVPARVSAPTIQSRADATHPQVMAEVAKSLAASGDTTPGNLAAYSAIRGSLGTPATLPKSTTGVVPPLQREVFGFAFGASSLSDPTYGYPAWSFNLLTTIAYFGLTTDWDGTIIQSGSGWTTWNSSALTGLIATAHANRDRVILSINLHDFSTSPTSTMCAALHPTHRAVTVSQTVAQIQRMNADGVNLDYEGTNTVCAYQVGTTQYGKDLQSEMTSLAAEMRAALPSPYYVAVDTYSGSAGDSTGFFNIPALAPSVNSFFVMTYDMEYYNWSSSPLNCTSFCLGPTSPLTTYLYNDTKAMADYIAAAGASKVILGIPYYGRKECVANATPSTAPPNAYPVSGSVASDGYLDASTENGYNLNSDYHAMREVKDTAGNERMDTWSSSGASCTREMYFDDVDSIGRKYDLVNRDNLRGAGIFALQYGGGAPELWDALGTHFTHPFALASVDAAPASTQYNVAVGAYYGGVISSFDLISNDVTAGTGAFLERAGIPAQAAGSGTWSGSTTVYGYPGHHYQYLVRAWSYNGLVSAWSAGVDATVATTATSPLPFKGMYTLRSDGFMKSNTSPPVATWQYWFGYDLARVAHPLPGASSPSVGAVLNAYGALLSYGEHLVLANSAYWPGQDLARDFAFLPNGTGGYVLDAHGNLWPFGVGSNPLPLAVHGNPHWPSLDIARKVVIFPDGTGGYVLDYTGGVNPFAIGSNPVPKSPALSHYWPNEDFARDMVLIPGTRSGFVLNGYGGLYAFTAPGEATPVVPSGSPYWSGHDVARGFFLLPGSTAASPGGYIMDCAAGLTPWGNVSGPGVSGAWACGTAKAITGG
jgi:spore germination protein YaaH